MIEILLFCSAIRTIRYDFIFLNEQILPYILFENVVWAFVIRILKFCHILLKNVFILLYRLFCCQEGLTLPLFHIFRVQKLFVCHLFAVFSAILKIQPDTYVFVSTFLLIENNSKSLLLKVERLL